MNPKSQEFVLKAKDILKKITFSGGEAYIIGKSVFNIINDIDLDKIDIYLNLDINVLKELFSEYKFEKINEGEYLLGYLGFEYTLLTDESIKENNYKPLESKKHYSHYLTKKMIEMDYSIYSMAMNHNNVVYDFYQGRKDITKRIIRSIYYNIKSIYDKYPIKMLEVIKTVSETGYKLENRIYLALRAKAKKICKLDESLIASEMVKIFNGPYFKKSLKYLYKTKLYKYLPWYKFVIKKLYKNYRKETENFFFGYEMIRKKTLKEEICNNVSNEFEFKSFVNLAITNPESKYDRLTLFSYGVTNCILANRINYLLGRTKKQYRQIKENYKNLPIKKSCDLAFKGQDMLEMGDIPLTMIEEIQDEVISLILDGKLVNDYETIRKYVVSILNGNTYVETNDYDKYRNNINNDTQTEEEIIIKKDVTRHEDNKYNYNKNDVDFRRFEELQKKQDEFNQRLIELEIKSLKSEIDYEVRKKISESKILDNVIDEKKEETFNSIYNSYYEFLVNSQKYQQLKKFLKEQGDKNDN